MRLQGPGMSMKQQIAMFSKIIYVGGELRVHVCMGLSMAEAAVGQMHDLQIAGPAVVHSKHARCTMRPPHP